MIKIGLILFLAAATISGIVAQITPDLSLPEQSNGVITFDISGIADDKLDKLDYNLLSVFVATETNEYATALPIQGNFSIVENKLIFKPYFPFEKGLAYVIRLKNSGTEKFYYLSFQIGEKEKNEQAKLLSIFPTADLLPENLLRFYFYFQTPMKQEEALKHIKLIDEKGNVDDHAFMKFKEELWSNDGKRLTVLFDPGRIKRGVSTNVIEGSSLENGRRYHLKISGEWKDVYEQSLVKKAMKEIRVVEPYRKKINIEEWAVSEPRFDSLDKLIIDFDRIIDHTLIQSMMQVKDGAENLVEGYWETLSSEQQVQFVPKNKWQQGSYKIVFDTRLEDVAGNNLQNLLDHNIMDKDVKEIFQFIDFKIL